MLIHFITCDLKNLESVTASNKHFAAKMNSKCKLVCLTKSNKIIN